MPKSKYKPVALQRFEAKLRDMGCLVCEQPNVELAHCAGKPSVKERIQEPKAKGWKLPRLDWLILPLCQYHHQTAPDALDRSSHAFESHYGSVAEMIDLIAEQTGIDVWSLARKGRK